MLVSLLVACLSISPQALDQVQEPQARVWMQELDDGVSVFADLDFRVDGDCGDVADLVAVRFNGLDASVEGTRIDGECIATKASLDIGPFEGDLLVEWVAESAVRSILVEAAAGPVGLRLASPESGIIEQGQDIVVSWDSPDSLEGVRLVVQGSNGQLSQQEGDSQGAEFTMSDHEVIGEIGRVELNMLDWSPPIQACPQDWTCTLWDAVWAGPKSVALPEIGE